MKNWQKLVVVFIIAATALIAYFGFGQHSFAQWLVTIVGGFLALTMFIDMIKTLKSGSYGVDLLAITAIIATLIFGEFWAALIIVLMLVGGETLEDYAAGRANRELSKLLEKSPEIAHVKSLDNTIIDTAIDDVPIGATLVVKPLEVIPIDGTLISDNATLDESSITGESKPRELTQGDQVMSGSLNGSASIELQTTVLAEDSQFQKIIHLVRQAEQTPANFVRLADRYAIPFTIAAYIIALVAYLISGDPLRIAQVLVVASPCPLILAAPIAFVSGMSRSSQNGFLIKNGAIIEKLASAKRIFFDKTGTITDGQISLDAIHPTSEISAQELLTLAYTLEQSSSHILAKAVTAHATENGLAPLALENLQEIPGQGVQAQVGGHDVKVGRATFVGGPTDLNYETAIYVSRDGSYLGAITFSDTVRPEAREVMSDLSGLGLQDITMLTGDNAIVAKKIAGQVGIQDIYANLLPGQKLEHIKDATPKPTIMVGDGVNDAPALTLADVGISVGTGNSTVASEAADVVLLKNDLTSVVKAITISRDTMRIARQSVLIGIFICVILMLVAATGVIPAIIGAFCQEIVDVVSILYALRALKG